MSSSAKASSTLSPDVAARKARLSALARAPAARLAALWADYLTANGIGAMPAHQMLRGPEIGTVMVRGRAGGRGAPFNLGEVTVTRASLRLSDGTIGHGHVQGRSHDAARIAAMIDALAQRDAEEAEALDRAVLAPLRTEAEADKTARAARADATRVEFFTMVRGENA